MTKRSVRLTLFLACVGAIGYAAFLTWSSEQHVRATGSSSTSVRHDRPRRVRRRSPSCAPRNRPTSPSDRARSSGSPACPRSVKDLDDKLAALKSVAAAPEAVTAVDDASGALQDFEQMDARARDYTRGRQLTLASDLVFTDGFDLTKKAGAAVERAVTAELVARDAFVGNLRRNEGIALAGAAGRRDAGIADAAAGGTAAGRGRRR